MSTCCETTGGSSCGCGDKASAPVRIEHTGAMRLDPEVSLGAKMRGVLSRWGVGRDSWQVSPGLYSLGSPGRSSNVLVTANYGLTVDKVRSALRGLDAWLLVIDTKGINVWCAAGKGTFGTEELVGRIKKVWLERAVDTRTLILPQLGAPGVAAHEVTRRTGFKIVYGPVRVCDLPEFLAAGMKAAPRMREVDFPLGERLMLGPLELLQAMKYFLLFAALMGAYSWLRYGMQSIPGAVLPVFGAILAGTLITPALLPWLPGRAFAIKGWTAGLVWAAALIVLTRPHYATMAAQLLALPALSSFLALNFTGATVFTNQNGVNKEIALFARPIGILTLAGATVWVAKELFI